MVTNASSYKGQTKPRTKVNQPSLLLSKEENDELFQLMAMHHRHSQSLATAVVQLFVTSAPGHTQWKKHESGVLMLVKDHRVKSYYFDIYCPVRRALVWQQEIYVNMDYKNSKPFFHMFEADDSMAGFNFASEDEATLMRNTICDKLESRRNYEASLRRKDDNRSKPITTALNGSFPQQQRSPSDIPDMRSNASSLKHTPHHTNKSRAKAKLTKADISAPANFVHVCHLGWDPIEGFVSDNISDSWKQFFHDAGLEKEDLQNKRTREIVYDFIAKRGGFEEVERKINAVENVDVIKRPSAPKVEHKSPAGQVARSQHAPPVPARNVRPAPALPARGQPRSSGASSRTTGAMPPPPPPPPMPDMNAQTAQAPPPPPPPPPMDLSDGLGSASDVKVTRMPAPLADPRSALMESIKSGATLKHVEVTPEQRTSPSAADPRSNLLREIQQGIELKPVTPNASKQNTLNGPVSDLAGALALALAQRSKAMHESDSSSSESDDPDEDDWED